MDPDCAKHDEPANHSLKCTCIQDQYPRDWKTYFELCHTDLPNLPVIRVIQNMAISHKIWILSARSADVLIATDEWLTKHNIPNTYLQLRGSDDRTPDDKLKLSWAEKFNLTPKNTLFVMEDRTRMVNAWREAGFACFQVAPGDF